MTDNNCHFPALCSALADALNNVIEHPRCPDYLAEILADAILSIANEMTDDARIESGALLPFVRLVERRLNDDGKL